MYPKNMAGVVKWLRPRIVVPICMGSNPISRPIFEIVPLGTFLFSHSYYIQKLAY